MARAALGWGVRDLAAAAGISTDTVARFEREDAIKPATQRIIREAFERAGVIFVAENGEGPGVRLRKERPAEALPSALVHHPKKRRADEDE